MEDKKYKVNRKIFSIVLGCKKLDRVVTVLNFRNRIFDVSNGKFKGHSKVCQFYRLFLCEI